MIKSNSLISISFLTLTAASLAGCANKKVPPDISYDDIPAATLIA